MAGLFQTIGSVFEAADAASHSLEILALTAVRHAKSVYRDSLDVLTTDEEDTVDAEIAAAKQRRRKLR